MKVMTLNTAAPLLFRNFSSSSGGRLPLASACPISKGGLTFSICGARSRKVVAAKEREGSFPPPESVEDVERLLLQYEGTFSGMEGDPRRVDAEAGDLIAQVDNLYSMLYNVNYSDTMKGLLFGRIELLRKKLREVTANARTSLHKSKSEARRAEKRKRRAERRRQRRH